MKQILISLNPDQSPRLVPLNRFEELFDIQYVEQLQFDNWEVESWIRCRCERAKKENRIGKLALWLGKLHGGQLDRAEIPNVTIKWMGPHIGYGVFANQPFKKWQFIGEYAGLLRRRHYLARDVNDYCFMYPRYWFTLKSFTIDSVKQGNFTRFINHSDKPNCESIAVYHNGIFHILFRTIECITPGEELTYDYGNIYWSRRKSPSSNHPEELITSEDLIKLGHV